MKLTEAMTPTGHPRSTYDIRNMRTLFPQRRTSLRRFVEAAGGTLELRVELPGTGVLRLTGIGEIGKD
jgi:hypothetical protein